MSGRERILAAVKRWRSALSGAVDLNDVFVFSGLVAAAYGIGQIHGPSAWIVVGTVLLLLGLRR